MLISNQSVHKVYDIYRKFTAIKIGSKRTYTKN